MNQNQMNGQPIVVNAQGQQVPYNAAPQMQQGMPQQMPQPSPEPKGTSGLAIAGFILGIVAILTSFMPIINNISFFLAILGLILAIAGIVGINKGKARGKGFAIAAIVLNIISFVVVLASQAFYGAVLDAASDSLKATPASSLSQSASTAASDASSTGTSSSDETAASAYIVSIDGAEVTSDYAGKQAIVVTYTFTNNSTKDTSFMLAVTDKAFQNGVQLTPAIVTGLGSDSMKEIKTGSTITVQQAYSLDDSSTVTVEVEELFDFNDNIIASATFNVA